VDGKEYPAQLLPAEEARKKYEEIVRKNRDPALLEWMGSGMFQTSVFPVPPGAERKVTLRYSQLCRKDQGLTDFLFPLSTAKYTSKPLEKLDIQVSIESSADIKNVYSPSHAIEIKRPDNRHATISFSRTNEVPTSDFRLFYDVGSGQVGASVISYRPKDNEDGYFLLLASPEIKSREAQRLKKIVMFVVDRSGSMSGKKFEQAQGALKFVLNNLREGDLFNIVAYDSVVESFRPELQKFDDETRKAALGYVEGLYAGGSTNISGALAAALSQLKDNRRPSLVIFLTDGLPTDGETNEAKIVAAAKSQNSVRARLFAFGVGYDVNSRLLDRLVRTNFGQSEYVKPNEDIESRVSALYNRIGSPVMTDLGLAFNFDGAKVEAGPPVSRVYPAETRDLFAGEQLVLVGRYRNFGAAKVVIQGKVGDEARSFDFPATFAEKSGDDTNAFVEKLWAVRRVGEIIDELDLKGRNEELVKELVELSTKHGILTPYTAFLADENAQRHDVARNAAKAGQRLSRLSDVSGQSGFSQRAFKGALQNAEAAAQADARFSVPALEHASGPVSGGAGSSLAYDAYDAAEREEQVKAAQNVLQLGRKTFYRRGNGWVDSSVSPEQEKNARKIERFSAAYFNLVEQHGKDVAKYLSIEGPVTCVLDGQAYSF
jgi:Ca-activated chloride channel family protein